MKILILKDKTELSFEDASTISMLQATKPAFSLVDSIKESLTAENLSEVTFDDVEYKDLTLGNITASAQNDDVSIIIELKTQQEAELDRLTEQVEQLEAENTSLKAENEMLSDKAEAADILLGNEEV